MNKQSHGALFLLLKNLQSLQFAITCTFCNIAYCSFVAVTVSYVSEMIAMSRFIKRIRLNIVHMKNNIHERLPWKLSVSKSPMAFMYENKNASCILFRYLSSYCPFDSAQNPSAKAKTKIIKTTKKQLMSEKTWLIILSR